MQDAQEVSTTTWLGVFAVVVTVLELFNLTQQHQLSSQINFISARLVEAEESLKIKANTSSQSDLTPDTNPSVSPSVNEPSTLGQSPAGMSDNKIEDSNPIVIEPERKSPATHGLAKEKNRR